MTTKPPMIITPKQITVVLNGRPLTADTSHGNYAVIKEAIIKQEWDTLEGLFDIQTAVNTWSQGVYTVTEDGVYCDDERLPSSIERRVLQFFEEGIDFEFLINFHKRLKENPSRRAVQELYSFLEHESIPIDAEGYFYAYKSVREDWTDHHSGKCHNGIGTTLSMARNAVDDDANRGCSYGYHVGSLKYASSFGGSGSRLLICKIDPADVVSVPHDCAHQKVRTCKYTVIEEYTGPLPETVYRSVEPDIDYDYFEDDDDTEEDFNDDFDGWSTDDIKEHISDLQRSLQDARDAAMNRGI